MLVSILQMMGFPMGKPVHSPPSPSQHGRHSKVRSEVPDSKVSDLALSVRKEANRDVKAQTISARRPEVKAKTGKVKVVAQATKVAKAVVKASVTPKLKPVGKVSVAPKSSGKAVVKGSGKPSVAKAATVKARPSKAALIDVRQRDAKTTSKTGKVVPVKVVKALAKVKEKDLVKPMIEKTATSQATAAKAKVMPVLVPAKPAASSVPVSAGVPARAGRPSSRLAQLTVPSMAQSVASTAAKASFTQTPSAPLIVPPLASVIKKDPKLANNWKTKSAEQITDAELIAMPDDEYMNEFQMAFFRRRLLQLKKDILSNAGETTEHLREDTVVVPDPADRATIEEEHALELRTRDRERKLLKKIEQSIARIDAGDYGYCDETGEPIGVGRLLARPTANLSLEAQQRRELKQKMFGD